MWQNTAVPSLRQPKDFQSTQNKTTIVDKSPTSLNNLDKPYTPQMLDEIVANSSLKVDAPEFIPRSETKQPISGATSRIQNRLKIPRCELECDKVEVVRDNPEYIPQSYVDTETDLKRIRQLIKTLTKNPGQFDDLLQIFMETVTPYLEDIVLLSDIVQILVNEAIENANFRYTGAKLCLFIEPNCPSFRAELHLRCKKKLEEDGNLQNVLLFIAELYVQLPHVNIYGALLFELFEKLLAQGSSDGIKCIYQALKLTGYSLESSNKKNLDDIMNKLESIKNIENGPTLSIINRILLLRQTNWGMVDAEQFFVEEKNETAEENIDPNYDYEDSEQAFYEENFLHGTYLSDNTVLTQEEEEFLATNMISNEEFYSHPDSEDDPEMDDEIQEAYEEFLKTCKH